MRLAVIARAEQGRREYEKARDLRGVSVSDYYVVAMRALFLRFDAGRDLTARVPLLESVADQAREMEARATGKAMQPTPEMWQRLIAALAALDAQETK